MSQYFSSGQKAGKSQYPSLKAIEQEEEDLGEGQTFVLARPSANWVRPTIVGRAVCLTQSTYLNVTLIPKHPQKLPE